MSRSVKQTSFRCGIIRLSTRPPRRILLRLGSAGLTLILAGGWLGGRRPELVDAGAVPGWQAGVPVAIPVCAGTSTFRVPTPDATSEVLVVVSALARSRGPFPIELSARSAGREVAPALAADGPIGIPKPAVAAVRAPEPRVPARALPARERTFHMMVRDGDPSNPGNYAAVRGVLKGAGRAIQVYAAAEDCDHVGGAVISDIISTCDDRILPAAARQFGAASDVDGDGRFTILISSCLDRLGGGRYSVDGFVRVTDLDPAFAPPLGNRCDMMYISAKLQAGPYLRTLLAHEYMHAVIFSQKMLQGSARAGLLLEEEGWLDEAMAHLAEDLHGFSTSNIDYRVHAFLARPERYQLVVDDYYAADLFRSHGNRGSTYLFLRWCADRYGPGLLPALVHSRLRGTANLEAATGATFAALFRSWSVALAESGQQTPAGEPGPAAAAPKHAGDGTDAGAPPARGEMCPHAGPRCARVGCDGPADRWTALGTTSHFVIVDGSASGAVEITVRAPEEAQLQVTALPAGSHRSRLDLAVSRDHAPGGAISFRATLKERRGIPVQLQSLCWEPLAPHIDRHTGPSCRASLGVTGIVDVFGTSDLPARGELVSRPIALPGVSRQTGPVLVTAIGTDPQGRRVAAWADLDLEPARLSPER
jgi:hypothetical protein